MNFPFGLLNSFSARALSTNQLYYLLWITAKLISFLVPYANTYHNVFRFDPKFLAWQRL